ncbi:16S rRNA (adenine(1518)-N(6)/adenine(1519)-N(6))-dimethyltransferase RsmA [Nostoc favosum]|uniref:Ribosomal RNA small subunit methyltransferase A n=1 Tax=Nostoc favosum CHAB5714 TaxID=2780399 RepID=A0ABS8IDZ9_9NOSO|nr:16S rRNA (adenine(1518)-N(6)/adenine(1519)-N(6))-dimethyltransferase RsmA [Nostoc favosum]MCC5602408.1 16S rRNA (adenine(1518)-N(6)/adenine(1519)-N(6))-dimethyltransferase RsmA [Nostoc favosum CHAB5714]
MIRPRKVFAQHWLKSEKALDAIIKAAECTESDGSANGKGDRVLEIGPGTGILTRRLLPLVQSLVAVEIDRDLCQLLSKQLGKTENFLLLQGDFLTLDLPSYLAAFPNFHKPNKVVANIPYNITGPIIEKLLGTIANPNSEPFDSIVLLVQKEVAERLYAKPGSKAFGALSVRVQYLAECELICTVPAAAFHPPPKVDSAVVRLRPRKIEIPALNPRQLENFLKLGFGAKRKMLRNNLQSVIERDRLSHLLEQLKINPQARAEDLGVQQWIILANELGVGSRE